MLVAAAAAIWTRDAFSAGATPLADGPDAITSTTSVSHITRIPFGVNTERLVLSPS